MASAIPGVAPSLPPCHTKKSHDASMLTWLAAEPQDGTDGHQMRTGDHAHADLLFLIMHYLSAGDCPEAAQVLEREALSKGLLPTRLDFAGDPCPPEGIGALWLRMVGARRGVDEPANFLSVQPASDPTLLANWLLRSEGCKLCG